MRWGRVLASVSGAAVAAALLTPVGAAQATPASSSTPRADVPQARTAPQRLVSRLVVKTRDGQVASTRIRGAAASLAGIETVPVVGRRTQGKTLLGLGRGLTLDDAWAVSRGLEKRADVVWAEPDVWVYPSASPVPDTDPLFPSQWDLWSDTDTGTMKAPYAWQRTTGVKSVVVAVLDTGLTVHPDITTSVTRPLSTDPIVRGYDFVGLDDVSITNTPILRAWTANDGTGRDSDPSDPGDWISTADNTGATANGWFQGCAGPSASDFETSSWHGTHVTGTIVAKQNNGVGITGIAPGVKVQPVRVLGKCGGYSSDIDDAITWASGGHVDGVPDNTTPAAVISMSLGGPGVCLPSTQSAIDGARSRGTTVVVAAGNESTAIWSADPTMGSQPADCSGVVDVVASDRTGTRASFSNYGDVPGSVTVAAPGSAIWSTVNSGSTKPVAGAYAAYSGTSMATPHVAAAVALLQSLQAGRTRYTAADIDALLPTYAAPTAGCPANLCGEGLLDLSVALPGYAPLAPTVRAQASTTSVDLTWVPADTGGRATTYAVQQSVNDGASWTATTPALSGLSGATVNVPGLTPGTPYLFRIVATNNVGSATSDPVGPEIPSDYAVQGVTVTGSVERLTVSWTAPAAGDVTGYQVRYRAVGALDWLYLPSPTAGTSTTLTTWPYEMDPGSYEVQVAAGHPGAPVDVAQWLYSDSRTGVVSALVQSITASATTMRPYRDGFQDSVVLRVATNRPGGSSGTLRIYDAKMNLVRSVALGTASAWTYVWTGLNSRNLRVPNGRYYMSAWIKGRSSTPSPIPTSPTLVTVSSVVASSQATKPVVTMTSTALYPYRDAYRDSTVIRATATVPSVFTFKVVRSGVTYWSASFSRRAAAAVVYAGARTGGGTLPAGTYALYVYAQGAEGIKTVAARLFTVSPKKLVKRSFSTTWNATVTYKNEVHSGFTNEAPFPSGGAIVLPERSGAFFNGSLPASVLPQSGLHVIMWASPNANYGNAIPLAGYFLGTNANPELLRYDRIQSFTPTLPSPTSIGASAGNVLRWYVYNVDDGGAGSSQWRIDRFTVTGTYYTLA